MSGVQQAVEEAVAESAAARAGYVEEVDEFLVSYATGPAWPWRGEILDLLLELRSALTGDGR